jgi:hypothetical protein
LIGFSWLCLHGLRIFHQMKAAAARPLAFPARPFVERASLLKVFRNPTSGLINVSEVVAAQEPSHVATSPKEGQCPAEVRGDPFTVRVTHAGIGAAVRQSQLAGKLIIARGTRQIGLCTASLIIHIPQIEAGRCKIETTGTVVEHQRPGLILLTPYATQVIRSEGAAADSDPLAARFSAPGIAAFLKIERGFLRILCYILAFLIQPPEIDATRRISLQTGRFQIVQAIVHVAFLHEYRSQAAASSWLALLASLPVKFFSGL